MNLCSVIGPYLKSILSSIIIPTFSLRKRNAENRRNAMQHCLPKTKKCTPVLAKFCKGNKTRV